MTPYERDNEAVAEFVRSAEYCCWECARLPYSIELHRPSKGPPPARRLCAVVRIQHGFLAVEHVTRELYAAGVSALVHDVNKRLLKLRNKRAKR